jgi:S-adenosylmethionine:tRNA ribosyltransferase-isomerase
MRTDEFDYLLPQELIAQHPPEARGASRLMVVDRADGSISHRVFNDLPSFLRPGDCLVINETKVIPARLRGRRAGTGGAVEILLVSPLAGGAWDAMVKPGARLAEGTTVEFDPPVLTATVHERTQSGRRRVTFESAGDFRRALDQVGLIPLPPYITEPLADKSRYQTVYAARDGSVAAPTAGLHFTAPMLRKIEAKGIDLAKIDLTVGPGTFQPVRTDKIENHVMHSERFEAPDAAVSTVNRAKKNGGRVIAVGTTSARVLETMTGDGGQMRAGAGETNIFIYPGYRFTAVDALITNFHLPRSTLLMLVCALAGQELIIKAYEEAVQKRYRFFSFGDAMLII